MATTKPLAYFDTGALSAARIRPIRDCAISIAYSDAHLADLSNSKTPNLELQFLMDREAYYIERSEMELSARKRDPFEAFRNRDDLAERYMAPLISFFSGGGPTQTDQASVRSFVEKLLEEEPLLKNLVNPTITSNGLTNRDIEQAIDKSINGVDFSKGLRFSFADIPAEARAAIGSALPDENPSFQDIVNAAIMLGLMGIAPSRGIRKRASRKSLEVASHDWIDAHHIAYGLHCSLFVSNDKTALKRARLLSDYWNIGKEFLYYDSKSNEFIVY